MRINSRSATPVAKKPNTKKEKKINKKTNAKVQQKKQKAPIKKVPTKKLPTKKPAKPAKSISDKKLPTKKAKEVKIKPAKEVKIKPAKPVAEKKVVKPSGPKGYTSAQYEKFKKQKKDLENQSNQSLKDMLKKNLQSMSGNKDEMIQKVADGRVLGRIPRCPKCFGGRPKFDSKAGTYYCPGYRDDVDFKNCHSTFTLDQLKRDPWQ